jgi:hypothetical protein
VQQSAQRADKKVEVMKVEPFTIDSEAEADDYLNDLLKHPEYRSMDEVTMRAHKYIRDKNLQQRLIPERPGLPLAVADGFG